MLPLRGLSRLATQPPNREMDDPYRRGQANVQMNRCPICAANYNFYYYFFFR